MQWLCLWPVIWEDLVLGLSLLHQEYSIVIDIKIIETPMAGAINEKYLEALKKAAALERIGKPEEIAQVVTGLCMNSYITGEVIRVDGGTRFPHI